jgi:hypothetical protein
MERIAAFVPSARLEIVPGCNHLNIMGKERALRSKRAVLDLE